MLRMFKVFHEEHVSRNDWRDGYGDYINRELVLYGTALGKNAKDAAKSWSYSTLGQRHSDWVFVELEPSR